MEQMFCDEFKMVADIPCTDVTVYVQGASTERRLNDANSGWSTMEYGVSVDSADAEAVMEIAETTFGPGATEETMTRLQGLVTQMTVDVPSLAGIEVMAIDQGVAPDISEGTFAP